jgi:hypothetical protein
MSKETTPPTTSDVVTEQDKGRCAPAPGSELKLSKADGDTLERIAKYDQEKLKEWELKLEQARTQVEYWKRQTDHSSALAIRSIMASWK